MENENYTSALTNGITDRGQRGPNARVVFNLAFFDRHVEVNAEQKPDGLLDPDL